MEVDERLRFLETRITSSLRPRNDDLKALFAGNENRQAFLEFCNNEDVRRLFVYTKEPKATLVASLEPPSNVRSKAVFFLKTSQATKLTKDNIRTDVVFTDCETASLKQLDLLAKEVYLPLLCTDGTQTYGKVSADKLMDILHRLMGTTEVTDGYVKGDITLPLPSIEVLAEAASLSTRQASVVHVLESSVIGWIKQIRLVLKHDPLSDLRVSYGSCPLPLDEVNLWKGRQEKILSINKQLDSTVASNILLNLDEASSAYSQSLHNVRKEISQALTETNENLRYLETLLPWFNHLHTAVAPEHLLKIFSPMLNTMMLVWSHSLYYHKPDNFHNLLEIVSNEVVIRAKTFVGKDILKNTIQSYAGLKEALRVCAAYRGTYLDMKDKADIINEDKVSELAEVMNLNPPKGVLYTNKLYNTNQRKISSRKSAEILRNANASNVTTIKDDEWEDSPWPARNAPCFNLMNSFMERCNDLLELVQTTRHFNLLQKTAEVGGAGTKGLDALVREIHQEFTSSMETFGNVVEDILDVTDNQSFEKGFFHFRSVVKDLEKRLATVLRQSFQQCPTIGAQLRLLEVFEGVSGREMVQEYLKDKDKQLINSFTDELIAVRSMFIAKMNSPPLHINLPPIVSCMTWIRALQRRIKEPMEKLRRISPHSLEGDAGWHLRDIYADTLKDFESFEEKTIDSWQVQLYNDLRDRLKQPLLISDDYDEEMEGRPQILHVNLDPTLLLLLREVHYLSKEPFSVKLPDVIRDLLRHADAATLRTTAARLATIVSKYNSAMKSMVDFERPLFERKLAKIDHLLDQGLNHYTWKMTESADFIELASSLVGSDLHRTLAIVQTNCQDMVEITQSWSNSALDVFQARDPNTSYLMDELLQWQSELNEDQERLVRPSGLKIHSLLQNSFEAVQISQASPAWEEYVDHIDALVLDGLKLSTLKSLRFMLNTLVHANVSELQGTVTPILTINLELVENVVTFTPPLDQSTAVVSVLENVTLWLEQFRARGLLVKMLNPLTEGTYQDYINMDEEVINLCQQILSLVQENGEECKKLLELFKGYTFLWLQDITETFDEFLHGRLTPNPLRMQENTASARLRSAASERSVKSAHSGRASSASNYSISQTGAMGTAEKAFLRPNSAESTSSINVPSLDMFDSEIDIYRSARDEIVGIVNYRDVGWIRVDLKPIKQVLTTYASRWMWTFTKYLSDQVTALLLELDKFLKRIEPEIESITGEERDTASFMKMMRIFNEVSAKQQEMDGQFTAMNRTVLLLKKYEQSLPDKTNHLYDAAPGRWNNLKTKVSLAKQRLGPRIQEESASITKDLQAFGKRVEDLKSELSESEVYTRGYFIDEAFDSIKSFMEQLDQLDNEAQDLIELQELLETAVVNFTILPECRHELRNLHQVWETVQTIQEQQESWKQDSWQKQNTKFLKDATNEQLERVNALPEESHVWDVYIGLQESILIIQACLPLIEDLSNPAMRTRHWKQLVRVTGGALLTDNDSLQSMTLGQLLQLGLQNHADEVRSIVQRAIKDVTIEGALKTYEEIWLSKLFDMRLHARSLPGTGLEKGDKDDTDTKSEYSQSQSDMSISMKDPSKRRVHSRMSSLTIGAGGRQRRASVSSLPASLLNLGEDSGVLFLLTDTESIFTELESHQVALQGMQSSSAAGSFLDEVTKWQKRLQTIEAVLTVWLEVQEKWIELEEVYSGNDIKNALSHEASLFTSSNRDFRLLMRATEKNPNVLQCCQRKGILTILEKMNNNLHICRKSLLQHLEKRRQRFPRFYFLSMEDVLHIVCNGYDINQVNLYLPKLFENLGRVEFEEVQTEASDSHMEITGLISRMGEKMSLKQSVSCEGAIENWLANLLPVIKSSLQQQLVSALSQEILQDGITPRRLERERSIQSAGARRVIIDKENRKAPGSRSGSRANSRTGVRPGRRPSARESQEGSSQPKEGSGGSWLLDHATEVIHLALQIQMTQQVEKGLKALEGGDGGDALKDLQSKMRTSIQAAVIMLKGIEDPKEKADRLAKKKEMNAEAMEKPVREGSVANSLDMSQTGRQSAHSHRGSQWSLNEPPAIVTAPPIAEEGSIKSGLEEVAEGLDEEGKPPVDTMKVVLPPERPKVKVVVEEQIDKTELQLMLFPGQMQKVSNLVALMAHNRDCVDRLLERQKEGSSPSSDSFEWKSGLFYNWDESTSELSVKIMESDFSYGFEYLGSAPRLVLTPSSMKMFVSMTQAIQGCKAGLCVGSNSIGRVETLSELSRVVGQPLYSFNCSKTTDAVMLGDIFRGLASTGAWICINNINFILPAALSIFSQLLQSYLDCLKAKKNVMTFPLQGEEVTLHANGACFATLDSQVKASSMYVVDQMVWLESAVSKLPRDISHMFRPVAVISPDFKIVLEVMLLSQGFTLSGDISTRFITLKEMYSSLLPSVESVTENASLGSHNESHGWTQHTLQQVITEAGSILDELIEDHNMKEQEKEFLQMNADSENNNNNQIEDEPTELVREQPEGEPDQDGDEDILDKFRQFEYEAVVMAIRNTYMPRLHGSDAEMFAGMVEDVFPDVGVPMMFGGKPDPGETTSDKPELNIPIVSTHPAGHNAHVPAAGGSEKQALEEIESAIAVASHDLGLLPAVAFQSRVAQLAQLMDTHQTVLVVGPAGCGKSESIKTLLSAHREMGKIVSAFRVYTQSVESYELLGYPDPETREWKDGLFTTLLRKLSLVPSSDFMDSSPHMKVLHLDGEIDPYQMEVFGCIFQNPASLSLANNERISLPENLRLLWELESLANVAPSVLSHIGVLSMDKSDVSWQLILMNWLKSRPDEEQEILEKLMDRYVKRTLEHIDMCTRPAIMCNQNQQAKRPHMKRIIDVSEINMVTTFCNILESTIPQGVTLTEYKYEHLINFAAIWAFAGTLEEAHRSAFNFWWRSEWEEYVQFPEVGEVFDYFVDGETQEFIHWKEAVPPYSMPPHEGIPLDAYVHTVSNEQISYLLGILSDAGKPVMLVGDAGCGKTAIVNDRIRTVCSGEVAEVLSLTVTNNRFTTSRVLWQRLEERLEWRHGRTFVPKGNKKLMCLVDDLNLAFVDSYSRQSACEMVRQHLDCGGVYEPDTYRMREVKNLTYVATVNPHTSASVPQISPRLLRHFAVLGIPYPRSSEVHTIFTTLLNTHFLTPATTSSNSAKDHRKQFVNDKEEEKLRALISMIVTVTIEVQDRMRTMFLPTAQRCHYLFTLRDMRRIYRNICLSLKPGVKLESLMMLWRHECEWVYGGRLVSPVDIERYNLTFVTAARKEFTSEELIPILLTPESILLLGMDKSKVDEIMSSWLAHELKDKARLAEMAVRGEETLHLVIDPNQPLFSNLVQQDSGIVTAGGYKGSVVSTSSTLGEEDSTDQYRPCEALDRVRALVKDAVDEYNKSQPKLKLSLYQETIQRVCRLARTIQSPHDVAHILIVAEGNPGLASLLARLAANLCGFNTYDLNSSPSNAYRQFKLDQFKSDLVAAYTKAGVRGEKIIFLLNEEELQEEDFLVYMEEYVVTGAITHLFTPEEQTTVINAIRTEVTAAGLTYTRETAWDFFLKTVRNNFRVILVSSSTGGDFHRRCTQYPSLTEHLNCFWFQHWTRENLVNHAMFHLKDVQTLNDIQKENLAHLMATMHLSIRQLDGEEIGCGRYNHLTNTTYEKFVERFLSMYKQRYQTIYSEHATVTKALHHIDKENKLAMKLQKQLEHELVVLEERKEGTIKLLSQIGQDTAIAEQQVKIVQKQLDHIQKLRDVLPRYALAHEKAVFKTVAIVQDTKKVVEEMDLNSLGELRAMQKPDVDIEDLMAAIIMILKSPSTDLTWKKGAKRQMANLERFMEELSSFDDHELPETTLNLVEPYLKKASFQPQNLLRKTNSVAAASLCKWVRGVVRYHRLMISKVKPLHTRVEETTAEIGEAERKLSMLESKKQSLEARLLDLAQSFEGATVDKNDQDELSVEMEKQLQTANRFREILAMEYEHCQQICQSVNQREFAIFGAVAIAAGFATYLGPYEHRFRKSMLTIHWPLCLQERGVPLVIDAIDPMKGWIIEWAIATEAKSRPSTSALLSVISSPRKQDTRQEVEDETEGQPEEAKVEEDGGEDGDKAENEEQQKEKEEMKDPTEEAENEGEGGEADAHEQAQEAEETVDNVNNNAGNQDYAFSEAAETHHSHTVDSFPQVTAKEYEKYIQAMLKLLVGDLQVQEWITKGLSLKQMENLAIQKSSWQRPPLLVDPNMEGVQVLRKYIQQGNLVNIDMSSRFDPSIVVRIEKAILSGRPLLLMNCEDDSLDNMVTPLIHHANNGSEIQGPEDARLIKYCGRRLLGHENFCVTMATTSNSPTLSSRIASSTVVVNYCATPETLREELLDRAFQRVLPHLYEERRKVMKSLEELRSTLKALDDKLLVVLEGEVDSNAITSHTVYVSSIVDNKHAVYSKLQELEQIISTLDTIKDGLQAVAKRGAMLYSIGTSLRGIQREYHLSLPFFLWMFDQAVGEDPPEDSSVGNGFEGGLESDEEDSVQQLPHSASTKLSRIPREESLEDGQRVEDAGGEGTGEGQTHDDQPSPAQEDTTPAIDINIPHVRDFPSEGVEYNSLSANHVKQLVDSLTQTVFQNVRQTLYEEHRLLFATMICLNIQYETLNIFSEEELSLLLQGSVCKKSGDRYVTYDLNSSVRFPTGNPGLGTMDLTLKDFDSDASPPEFLPSEKWEDLMAVSVLPGPLDAICVQLAENPEPWEKWYRSEDTEMEPLPLRPTTSAQKEKESNEGVDRNSKSRQSTPDLGDLSDFHQLVLLRLLRPDRFTIAASKYVSRHLTVVKALPTSIGGMVRSVNQQLGVLILMPPTPACGNTRLPSEIKKSCNPTEILREYAKRKSIPFQSVTLGEGTESLVSMMIDAMTDKEGWLVLESLHLASQEFLSDLKHQLVRGGNMGGPLGMLPISRGDQSRCCIWMTSEPSTNIPYFLIQNLRIITWDNLTPQVVEEGEAEEETESFSAPSLDNTLKTAILSSLQSISASHLQALQESSPSVRAASYAMCVVHGLLVSRQMFGPIGLSKLYSLNDSQISHAIDIVLGSKFKEQNGTKELSELGDVISEFVYSNIISDSLDQIFVKSIVHHVLTSACSASGSIQLGHMTLGTPPANVDVADFAKWLTDRWSEREDSFSGLGFNQLVKRSVQRSSGLHFLRYLGDIYELQHSGPHSQSHLQRKLNLTKVQNAVDAVSEKLPPLLDLGELPLHIVNEAEKYTFPYHAPSLMSLLSVATNEMPQSIGFVLLQECHWLNSLLCHVRQSLHRVEMHVLGGEEAMPEDTLTVAKALQEDAVPSSWVHPNRLPCGHSIISWVADLKKRHDQMRSWIKEGKVPGSSQDPRRPLDPHGYLSSMWLGGLVNPGAVITALRLEKSVLEKCLLSEVDIACEVRSISASESTESIAYEGGLYLSDVYLEGAAWDVDKGAIVSSGDGLCLMPKLYIYPTLTNQRTTSPLNEETMDERRIDGDDGSDTKTDVYSCPVFVNGNRQVCSFQLELPCLPPSSQWEMQRVAIILDPGIQESGPRKWPKPAPRATLPKPPQQEHHQESSPDIPPELYPEEATADIPPPSRDSRRSALSTIHEGKAEDVVQQSVQDGQSRSGSSRTRSQGSKRPPSQQSKLSGKELEAMDEETDEQDAITPDDEEEMDPEEFEALLTARSMNLGNERHLTSVFDYRSPQKKASDNVNQNANADDENGEESDALREEEEEEDAAASHHSFSDEEEKHEDNASDQDSYRSESSRGSKGNRDEHVSGNEDDVRPVCPKDKDHVSGDDSADEERGREKSEEEDEFPDKAEIGGPNDHNDDEDLEEETEVDGTKKDDFFDTTSRASAASQKMRDSDKEERPLSGQSHKSDKSERSAGSRKSSKSKQSAMIAAEKEKSPYGSRNSLRSMVKDSSDAERQEDLVSMKKEGSLMSNKSMKPERTTDNVIRTGSAGSTKSNKGEGNIPRRGSQTSFKSAQGIYGQGKESMKRAGSGGSRSSQHSGKERKNVGERKGSADSQQSGKKSVSGVGPAQSMKDHLDGNEGKQETEIDVDDARDGGDENMQKVRPTSAASVVRSSSEKRQSSRASLNEDRKDDHDIVHDGAEKKSDEKEDVTREAGVNEDKESITDKGKDANWIDGHEDDRKDDEREVESDEDQGEDGRVEKREEDDGEKATTEMLEEGKENGDIDEEGVTHGDTLEAKEASQADEEVQDKDTRPEKAKSLLEGMLENGDERRDDGDEDPAQEAQASGRPRTPGEDSVDNKSIFDKEAPAY